ncbi:hypothetical protein GCM10023189_04490 [Nibrella saemangeumensis]|uniref:Peptidyl-prolyl cis-trans isomerase n=1 Tax=Nibrella saemangeumensis TaxID=1084526 RepID=A0ABP8MF76_9BACT
MLRRFVALWGLAVLVSLSACKTNYVDPDQSAAEQNETDIKTYVTQNNLNAQRTTSGLYYVITTANPNGKKPGIGDELEFNYKLFTLGNVKVDSSKKDTAVYLPFGLGAMLPGLEEGMSLMREGEKATLLMPAYLAFGSRAQPLIPANSAVRFDVQLLRARTEDQQIQDYLDRQKLTVSEATTNGVRVVKTTTVPTGAALATGQTVKVNYAGRLLRGKTDFDKGTIDVTLGQRQVVAGFEEGISKLRVGEKALIIFPSAQGYGTQGRSSNGVYVIPPYSPLAFEIEVVSVR